MKILCCNIRRNMPEDEAAGNGWDARKELCAEVISAQNADIICLQESMHDPLADLLSRLEGYQSFGLANPDTVFNPTNVILFVQSRFEMVSAGGFWLSEAPHVAGSKSWDSARPRFVNWVHLKERETDVEFRIWNGHLDHIGQVAREEQAQLIVEASQALPQDLPQLFAADCNADAANPAIERLKTGGWLDSYEAVHGPEDPGFTFHAFLGPRFAEERPGGKIKGKIDCIFCRGPARVLDAGIIRDGREGRYPSDHYFVSAEVRLG